MSQVPMNREAPLSEQRRMSGPATAPPNSGAGEGIRTLDPNLGKVVLYP